MIRIEDSAAVGFPSQQLPDRTGGMGHAPAGTAMGVRRYRELFAWQLADQFKREIVRIVQSSPAARTDLRYRSQILEAARAVAKNIAEGFMRRSPLQFASFLDYAVASLAEAEDRLRDGIEEGYFSAQTCEPALVLAKRCTVASIRLKASQIRYAAKLRELKPRRLRHGA